MSSSRSDSSEVQTRSETDGLCYFPTLEAAYEYAKVNQTVESISFSLEKERVILRRSLNNYNDWVLRVIAKL